MSTKIDKHNTPRAWGETQNEAGEMWDAPPVFTGETVGMKDKLKLLFYPKKFLLYMYVRRCVRRALREGRKPRVVDIGCGTGGAVIDMKKMFGRRVEVIGVDVLELQIDAARTQAKENGIWAEFFWFDGHSLPFEDETVDVVYTSDVLGHVEDVRAWLRELNRVMRPGATLAMFAESKLGRHAYIRNYLLKHGLNTDPHAQFHISLYSKDELKQLLDAAGFSIKKMHSVFWAKFFVHPDELYPALKSARGFWVLRTINIILHTIKKYTQPASLAIAELYGLIEMLLVGRWIESQGYIIHAKKRGLPVKTKEAERVTKFTAVPVAMEIPTAVREVEG